MSKKHSNNEHGSSAGEAAEYRIVKRDLVKIVILSVLFMVIILGLYYLNQQNGAVDSWFSQFLYF